MSTTATTAITSAAAPACEIGLSPGSIRHGESTRMDWSSSNATRVEITPDFGVVAPTGSIVVWPRSSTTYTITATNSSGVYARTSAAIHVGVTGSTEAALLSGSITATTGAIGRGEFTQLKWDSYNATEVTITPDVGKVAPAGVISISPRVTTTYTITMTNGAGGFGRTSATVYVRDALSTTPR
jgi:hypothetical protein